MPVEGVERFLVGVREATREHLSAAGLMNARNALLQRLFFFPFLFFLTAVLLFVSVDIYVYTYIRFCIYIFYINIYFRRFSFILFSILFVVCIFFV